MTDRPEHLDDLAAALAGITDTELRQALIDLDTPVRRAELARRLAPYRTPVTEATMQRRCSPGMMRAPGGSDGMATDRDRLTTFFYLLTRGTPDSAGVGWGDVNGVIDECKGDQPTTYTSKAGEALAREMVDRLLGPAGPDGLVQFALERGHSGPDISDFGLTPDARRRAAMGYLDAEAIIAYDLERERPASAEVHACIRAIADKPHYAPVAIAGLLRGQAETLRDAAKMLARVRGMVMSPNTAADIDEMIDRCNLASMGVTSEGSRDEPLSLATATGRDLDFAGEVLRRTRPPGELDYDFRDLLLTLRQRVDDIAATGATAAEIVRLRRFESGVTELIGEPATGTDKMLDRLRVALGSTAAPTDLRSIAKRWLEVSHEYWEAFRREHGAAAVVWVDSETGALAIYTRGEYAAQLRAAIPTEGGTGVHSLLPDPREVLASHGWRYDGCWHHDDDNTHVSAWCHSVQVTGERDMSPAELRAFAALAEGPTP